ncbi:uncharacterized protein CIMG_13130 [Coccidioides immitis RS]|uniref:Uncharacterized protein n=1 Tax=Coccidioides immitis (strain RS) TaxID=246410 RepID=A0A0E1S2C2_COCIM|nr:uncharacterized protein CIMG_13130 [Coccidioides immitis RS]EAS31773.2 hypothetical protein CIMG_13130 [Coccidioides immitis RS]
MMQADREFKILHLILTSQFNCLTECQVLLKIKCDCNLAISTTNRQAVCVFETVRLEITNKVVFSKTYSTLYVSSILDLACLLEIYMLVSAVVKFQVAETIVNLSEIQAFTLIHSQQQFNSQNVGDTEHVSIKKNSLHLLMGSIAQHAKDSRDIIQFEYKYLN